MTDQTKCHHDVWQPIDAMWTKCASCGVEIPRGHRFPDGEYISYWIENETIKGCLFRRNGKPKGNVFIFEGERR